MNKKHLLLKTGLGLAGAYLFAIAPSLRKPAALEEMLRYHYAHRGLHDRDAGIPENSLAAFQRAVDAGYGIELDVQLTKDNVAVIFHDDNLERLCGVKGRVCDFRYSELREFSLLGTNEKIPMLSRVLKLVAGKTPLIVEYKIDGNDLSVCAVGSRLLESYDGLYSIQSFHPYALRWHRQHYPFVMRGQLSDRFSEYPEFRGFKYFIVQNLLFNVLARPNYIAYHFEHPKAISLLLCRLLFRVPAFAWTVTSQEELSQAKRWFDAFIFEGFEA